MNVLILRSKKEMEGDVDPRNGKGTIIVMMITTMQNVNGMVVIVVVMI